VKQNKKSILLGFLVFGYAFLYAPIVSLVIFSFNESKRVTVWTKFSFRWYQALWDQHEILDAAFVSFKIAGISATMAVILGTLVAIALVRFQKFRARTMLSGMVTAPLVMPDVITGLALLFLFIILERNFGWPSGRGITTISIAHITLALAYVTVVVRTRLIDFDRSLEEAAMDLGAKPIKIFFVITLPIVAPALISGWLLAFTLSLDDVVLASFLSGPGSTTLPMIIFSSVRLGVSPVINALSTLIILTVTIAVIFAGFFTHRRYRLRHNYKET
jgi:putrescine transport system permease protein